MMGKLKVSKLFFILVIFCFLLTGCGNKECARWETRDETKEDCSRYTGSAYTSCTYRNIGKDGKVHQECVEWK